MPGWLEIYSSCCCKRRSAGARNGLGAFILRLLPLQVLPANLIQAQRDYFGAHTYERIDADGAFHTHWPTGRERPVG